MDRGWGPEPRDRAGRISLSGAQGGTRVAPDCKPPVGPGPWGPVAASSPGACLLSQLTGSLTLSPDPSPGPCTCSPVHPVCPAFPPTATVERDIRARVEGGATPEMDSGGCALGTLSGSTSTRRGGGGLGRGQVQRPRRPSQALPPRKLGVGTTLRAVQSGLRGWSLTARHL